ncbi:MAG: hypothetical protein KKB50_20105 [Planctomycetes bacterium]|nr:hypothetical protein [Planctomycetota bacterium]
MLHKSRRGCSRGVCNLNITVNTIDADTDYTEGYGGISSAVGYTASSSITVTNAFTQGAIGYPKAVVTGYDMPLNGTITIQSDLGAPGKVAKITTANPDTDGGERDIPIGALIRINGDLRGTAEDGAAIKVTGDLNGKILVDGSLVNGTGHDIEIGGNMENSAAITLDYDGWHDGHDWDAAATIKIGATTY